MNNFKTDYPYDLKRWQVYFVQSFFVLREQTFAKKAGCFNNFHRRSSLYEYDKMTTKFIFLLSNSNNYYPKVPLVYKSKLVAYHFLYT